MARKTRKAEAHTASSTEALEFIQSLQREFAGKIHTQADRQRLRESLAKHDAEKLRGIARRVMNDLIAPPVPEPAKPPADTAKRATTNTRRSRPKS